MVARIIENPKQLILQEAENLLFNEGYASISIRKIAKECGIAVGTIYNYFPTKKELIVTMMSDFWEEYFFNIIKIQKAEPDFYIQLHQIFMELATFLKRFKEIWLRNELYATPDYVESGLKRQDFYISRLTDKIEEMIIKQIKQNTNDSLDTNNSSEINDTRKFASFIIVNFISIIKMPFIEYSYFEAILKKLLE